MENNQTTQITDSKTILDFLSGKGADYKGRLYSEMLEWTDAQLECCHDQMQWFFPLHEESKHATVYPVLSKEIVKEAKQNKTILNNLRFAKDRMENFFGVGKYNDVKKQESWCFGKNHNLLRVTRIIRCLRIFGLNKEAFEFYVNVSICANNAFEQGVLSESTLEFWYNAMYNDVWSTMIR